MRWKHKINIKPFITDSSELEDGDSVPIHVREGIGNELAKVPELEDFREEWLNENKVGTIEQGNLWLNRLYDYCDRHAIWLGL